MIQGELPSPHGTHTTPVATDRAAIDRRTAMKAALGGAVAAAAWQAPRIEHLSIAPDFAQAATCVPTTGSVSQTTTLCDFALGFTSECYGGCATGPGDCADDTIVYPTEGTVTGEFPQGVTMTVVWSGFAEGSAPPGEGTADITVAGLGPNQTCNINAAQNPGCRFVLGSLDNAGFRYSPTPVGPFTATSPQADMNMGCYNNIGSQRQRLTITLTLACTCA